MHFRLIVFPLCAGLFFLPWVDNWFHGDDFIHLQWWDRNYWDLIFACFSGEYHQIQEDYNYRPISNIFFSIFTSNLSPVYLRSFMLILHVINAVLLFRIIFDNSGKQLTPLFIFYVSNQAFITNIYWASAIADLLCTFFALIAYYYWQLGKGRCLFLSLSFFIFALFSKETALIFPLFLIVHEVYLKRFKRSYISIIPFLVLSACFCFFRYFLLETIPAGTLNHDYFNFGLNTIKAIAKYAFDIFVPVTLGFLIEHLFLSILLIGYGLFLLREIIKHAHNKRTLFFMLITTLVLFFPVINSYGPYLYFPITFLLVTFAYRIKLFHSGTYYLWPYIILSTLSTFMYGHYYSKVGEYNRNFIEYLSKTNQTELRFSTYPVAAYNSVPGLNTGAQAEVALKIFTGQEKQVDFIAQTVRNNLYEDIYVQNNNEGTINLITSGGSYFYLVNLADKKAEVLDTKMSKPTKVSVPSDYKVYIGR